jgi:hypothetical protein
VTAEACFNRFNFGRNDNGRDSLLELPGKGYDHDSPIRTAPVGSALDTPNNDKDIVGDRLF